MLANGPERDVCEGKLVLAGEAEVGNAGEQPTKE
jgi:hypothetical protein